MCEKLKIQCADCVSDGRIWYRVYIPLIHLAAGEFNLVDVVEDRSFIESSDPDAMGGIMNHHNTVRSNSRGHSQFYVFDENENQVGFLAVSQSSQRLNTEHFMS